MKRYNQAKHSVSFVFVLLCRQSLLRTIHRLSSVSGLLQLFVAIGEADRIANMDTSISSIAPIEVHLRVSQDGMHQ